MYSRKGAQWTVQPNCATFDAGMGATCNAITYSVVSGLNRYIIGGTDTGNPIYVSNSGDITTCDWNASTNGATIFNEVLGLTSISIGTVTQNWACGLDSAGGIVA